MTKRLSQRKDLDALSTAAELANRKIDACNDHLDAAMQSTKAAKENFEILYQSHLSADAAQLAGHLVDGVPCPVCGSADHPTPASTGTDAPDKAAVDAARATLSKAESTEKSAHQALRAAQSEGEPKRAALSLLLEQLGEDAQTPIQTLEAAQQASQKALRDVTNAANAIPVTEAAIAKAQLDGQALIEETSTSQACFEAVSRALRDAQTRVDTQLDTVPKNLRTLEAAVEHRAQQNQQLMDMDAALKSAHDDLTRTHNALIQANTAHDGKVCHQDCAGSVCRGGKTLNGRILEAGSADTDAYRTAQLTESEKPVRRTNQSL